MTFCFERLSFNKSENISIHGAVSFDLFVHTMMPYLIITEIVPEINKSKVIYDLSPLGSGNPATCKKTFSFSSHCPRCIWP
jgi:hypothetical protein